MARGTGESMTQLWKDLPAGDDDEFPMRYTARFQARPAKGSALEKAVKREREKMTMRICAWRDVEKDGGFVPDEDGTRFFDVLGRRGKPEPKVKGSKKGLIEVVYPGEVIQEAPIDPEDILDDPTSYPLLVDPHRIAQRPMKTMTGRDVEQGLSRGTNWFAKQRVDFLPP